MKNVDRNLRKAAVLLAKLGCRYGRSNAGAIVGRRSGDDSRRDARGRTGGDGGASRCHGGASRRSSDETYASGAGDVELALSSSYSDESYGERVASSSERRRRYAKRFEFLENAPNAALVPHLAREHAQTIAVVLSHLPPERAAAVLAALPQKVQSETVERLSTLGETDPECVSVLKRELEAWAAERDGLRAGNGHRRDTMAAILAAADAKSRGQILSNMKDHKAALAKQFTPRQRGTTGC